MSWQDNALEYMAIYYSTNTYTSDEWIVKFNIAARDSIEAEYEYATAYIIDTTGAISAWTVSPDPSDDMNFIKFVVLKTWCMTYNSEIINRVQDAVRVGDGTSMLDTRSATDKPSHVGDPCDIFKREYTLKYGGFDADTGEFSVVEYGFANERY